MGTRLQPTWKPSNTLIEWATSEGYCLEEVANETDAFVDYWIAQSGSKATKDDWDATWRNWLRRALGRRREQTRVVQGRARVRVVKRTWTQCKKEYLDRFTTKDSWGHYQINHLDAFHQYCRDVDNAENGVSE